MAFRHWRRIARFPLLGFPRTLFLTVAEVYRFIDSFMSFGPKKENFCILPFWSRIHCFGADGALGF